jgi:hypothetical protein
MPLQRLGEVFASLYRPTVIAGATIRATQPDKSLSIELL